VRLPIDTTSLAFMCAAPARPVTDFETKQHKADMTTGELLYNLQVVPLDEWGAEVIQLKVAGRPEGRPGSDAQAARPGGDAVVDGRAVRRLVLR
jgi:hypothetical protein